MKPLHHMDEIPHPFADRRPPRWSEKEAAYRTDLDAYYEQSPGTHVDKLEAFGKFTPRQTIARFLALNEAFRMALEVQGDIIECGVHRGGGLMAFAQLSAIFEPVNLQRRIIGFDTFSGFPSIAKQDHPGTVENSELREGGFRADSHDDILQCIELFDANRQIGHVEKVMLVKGDAAETIPEFISANPHIVVSLLHLDFDLYEPTAVALEHFLPRMPKGGVIIFDELNDPAWPGETVAVAEKIGIPNLRLRRFPFEPHVSYAVIE